jgi:hypothetical protein
VLHTVKEERNILHTVNRRTANWIDQGFTSCVLRSLADSSNACVSVASRVAEGQNISSVPRSLCRCNSCVTATEEESNGCSVESDPVYRGLMSVCSAAQWVSDGTSTCAGT